MTTDQRIPPDGTGETARDEARNLKDTAVEAAAPVAETAKEKTVEVVTEVREQTRRLAGETWGQVNQQAGEQRDRAVAGLRAMSEDLRGMAGHGESAWVDQLARHGAGWTEQAADFLDGRELGDILDDCRAMARRRPGRFLLGALAAGVVAGRLSRALATESKSQRHTPTTPDDASTGTEAATAGPGGATTAPGAATTRPGAVTTGQGPATTAPGGAATGADEVIVGPGSGLGADRPSAEPNPVEPLGSPQPAPSTPDPGAPMRPGSPPPGL